MKTRRSAATLTIMFALGAGCAQAEESYYLGVGGGRSHFRNPGECSDVGSTFLNPGFSCNLDDTGNAWKVFAGYQFSKYGASEVGYLDLGKASLSASGTANAFTNSLNPLVATGTPTSIGGDFKATGWNVSLVGTLPVTEKFGLLGRIGALWWKARLDPLVSASGVGIAGASQSATGTKPTFGVGLKYDFAGNVGLRAEWERFKDVGKPDTTGQTDFDLWSASILYRF